MTTFCDFIPDDPSCLDANTGGNTGDDDGTSNVVVDTGDDNIVDGNNDFNTGGDDQEVEIEPWKPEIMTWEKFE